MQRKQLHLDLRDIIVYAHDPYSTLDDVVEKVIDYLEGKNLTSIRDCPYTHSHTKNWCGYHGCRES